MLRLKYIVSAAIKCCAFRTKSYKGGVKFIARVLREQAAALDKRSEFCSAASKISAKFWRKAAQVNFKIYGSAENR
nr:hypothetical protein [uncultured Campylobacter sp.]